MIDDDAKKTLCASLVGVMNDISGLLKAANEELSLYKGLQKIKNMAKNHDIDGIKKAPKYLDGIATTIRDNKAYSRSLGRKLEQADALVGQLIQSPASQLDE